MSSEISVVHKAIKEIINQHGVWYCKPAVCEGHGTSGQPDFLILMNGVLIGCEAKWKLHLKNGKVTTDRSKLPNPNQTQKLREIKRDGGVGVVIDIDHIEEFRKLMSYISDSFEYDGHSHPVTVQCVRLEAEELGIDIENYATDLKEVTV